ncbi:MAG: site-specific integrase [Bacteroidaceae bacterium]|nr:site-specific integrase [Bacteroidaceae bacterium]
MRTSHVDVIFDKRKRVAKCGKGLAEYRLYLADGVRKYIPIAEITPSEWEHFTESFVIQEQISKYERMLSAMEYMGKPLTLDNVNEVLGVETRKTKVEKQKEEREKKAKAKNSFILFFYDQLAAEKIQRRTVQAREVVYNSLLEFGRIKNFEDLTPANILDYHNWLQKDGKRKTTTLKHYHKRLHRYVLKAFEYGYIDRDPYKLVKIPSGQYEERRPLNEEEINLLRSLRLPLKEEKARDLFIFSCFTGLAYCDAQLFDFHTMTEKEGDLYYIDGKRLKTGSTFYTPILEPAMEVLQKYNFRLPRMSNQKLNDYLHLVESRACLNKKMTSHVARHTFATWVLAHDVPIENVTRMLGQKDVRTTQVYAKILPTTIQRHAETLNQSIKYPTRPKAKPNTQTQPEAVIQSTPSYSYTYSNDWQSLYISL